MIDAALFVACLVAFGWAGWRIGEAVLDPGRTGNDPALVAAGSFAAAAALVVGVMAALGGFGIVPLAGLSKRNLMVASIGVVAAVLLATRRHVRRPAAEGAAPPGTALPALMALGLLAVVLDVPLSFASAPDDWDAMTYHLFLPARWIQESRIFHVPTVFGDNAGAYAPQNGALIFGWSMLLLESDAATNVLQLSALAAIAAGIFWLARRIGAGGAAAGVAAVMPFFLSPLRTQVFSADVDAWMSSFFLTALVLLVHSLRAPSTGVLALAGLATGLTAGTKIVGLPLALPLLVLAVASVIRHRRPVPLIAFLLAALIAGGFWYLGNLLRYANPLFPLDFGVAPLRFAGAYGADAVRAGEFHIHSTGAVIRNAVAVLEAPTILLSAAGGAGLAGLLVLRPRAATLPTVLLLLALLWSAWFAWVLPHNSQARFLVPGLLVLLPGVALPVDRLMERSRRLGWSVATVGLAALVAAARPLPRWRDQIDVLGEADVAWPPIVLLGALALSLTAGAWWLRRRCSTRRAVGGLVVAACLSLVALVWRATDANEAGRLTRYQRSDFGAWVPDLPLLRDPAAPPATIAYSGANVPYILTGPGFRHRVVYVNTRGDLGDGFYEHWVRAGRPRFAYHKPGIYRSVDEEPGTWLSNLAQGRPDLLVLFRLHEFERRYLPHTDAGFPPESDWAGARERLFERVRAGHATQVYRVASRPGVGRGRNGPGRAPAVSAAAPPLPGWLR